MSQSDYSEFYVAPQVEASNLDSMSPYEKKLFNTSTTMEEKLALAQRLGLNKQAELDGYRKGYISLAPDADSGTAIDEETGQAFDYRLGTFNRFEYDAVDSKKKAESGVKGRFQPRVVAEMSGKNIADLTEFDYDNVKNYQFNEMVSSLTDPNHKFKPYDPNFKYERLQVPDKLPILYKVSETDKHGRNVIDAVNPATGRSIAFDASANPYLNARFDLFKVINSTSNQDKYDTYMSQKGKDFVAKVNRAENKLHLGIDEKIDKYIADYEESRSFLGQLIDKFGFSGSQAKKGFADITERFARHLSSDNPEKEYIENFGKDDSINLYDDFIDNDTARKLIYQRTQQQQEKLVADAEHAWNTGHSLDAAWGLVKALGNYVTILPEMLADSAGQTTLQMGAGFVGAKAGAALGTAVAPVVGTAIGGLLGGLLGYVAGSSAIAADETLQTMDEYARNNNGKRMSSDEIIATFGQEFLAAAPEVILSKLGLQKALGKSKLGNALFGKGNETSLVHKTGALKATGIGAVGEFGQEWAQQTIGAYHQQKDENRKGWWEIATDPQQVSGALAGLVMGGALSGASTAIGNTVNSKAFAYTKKLVEDAIKRNSTETVASTVADEQKSSQFIDTVRSTPIPTSIDGKIATAKDLRDKATEQGLSKNAVNTALQTAHSAEMAAIIDAVKNGKSSEKIEKEIGKTKEEVFAEEVFFSNYNADQAFEHGVTLTSEGKQEVRRQLLKKADQLGIAREVAVKTLDNVDADIQHGANGYDVFANKMLAIQKRLDENSDKLSENEKKALLNDRDGYLNSIMRLYSNQLSKLEQFATAAQEIANGKGDSSIIFRSSGSKFTVYSQNLANGNYEKGYGVYRLVRSIEKNLKDMDSILSKMDRSAVTAAMKVFDNEKAINGMQIRDFKRATSELNRFKSAAAMVSTRGKTEQAEKDKGKKLPTDKAAKAVVALAKADKAANEGDTSKQNARQYTTFTQQLRNTVDDATQEEIKAIANVIRSVTNDANVNDALSKLEELVDISKGNEEHRKTIEAKHAEVVKRVDEALANKEVLKDSVVRPKDTVKEAGIKSDRNTKAAIETRELLDELDEVITDNQDIMRRKQLEQRMDKQIKAAKSNEKTFEKVVKSNSQDMAAIQGKFATITSLINSDKTENISKCIEAIKDVLKYPDLLRLRDYVSLGDATQLLLDKTKGNDSKDMQVLADELTTLRTDIAKLKGKEPEIENLPKGQYSEGIRDGAIFYVDMQDRTIEFPNDSVFYNETEGQWFTEDELIIDDDEQANLTKYWNTLTRLAPIGATEQIKVESKPTEEPKTETKPQTKKEPNGGTLLSAVEAKKVEDSIVSDITFKHPVEVSVVNIKETKYGYTSRMLEDKHTLYIYGGRTPHPTEDMPKSIGNPYDMGRDESKRQEVIDKCWRNDLWLDAVKDNLQYIQDHPEITKVIFGCFCKPAACHLDKLPQLINAINAKSKSTLKGKDYTLHSGGAEGADTVWGEIGAKYGVTANHYHIGQSNQYNAPNGNYRIDEKYSGEEFAKFVKNADDALTKANDTLERVVSDKISVRRLLRRNYLQAKSADAVFAIGVLTTSKHGNPVVDSGTGWGVQMAIDMGKPVYVYDQSKKGWFTWDGKKFVPTETPTLTKNFAGIGTTKLNADGRQAIRDVYEKTFPDTKPQDNVDHRYDKLDGTRPKWVKAVGTSDGAIASTSRDGTITIFTDANGNPLLKSIQDFLDYSAGKKEGVTSKQKQLVFQNLAKKGYDEKFFKDNLKTVEDIYDFIMFHEKSHIRHNDASCYYDNGPDMLTPDKVAIETRATEEAIQEFLTRKKILAQRNTRISQNQSTTVNDSQTKPKNMTSDTSQRVSSGNTVIQTNADEKTGITDFRGDNFFLSNFFNATITYEGRTYKNVESAFQAAKFSDDKIKDQFASLDSAKKARELGRTITMTQEQVREWNSRKLQVMEDLLRQKFYTHPDLAKQLIATGKQPLVEVNSWKDEFWGVYKGKGDNNLGKLLDKIRTELANRASLRSYSTQKALADKYRDSDATNDDTATLLAKDRVSNTYTASGYAPFDLAKQIKLGKADSFIAISSKEYLSRIPSKDRGILEEIGLVDATFSFDKKLSYILGTTEEPRFPKLKPHKTKNPIVKRNYIMDNPHIRVLYDITRDEKGAYHIKYNDTVKAVIDYSLREFIGSSKNNDVLNPASMNIDEQVSAFGFNPDAISEDDKARLAEVAREYGLPVGNTVNTLGSMIARNLGLKPNSKGDVGTYEAIVTGLGAHAVDYGKALGLFKFDTFSPIEWNATHAEVGLQHPLNFSSLSNLSTEEITTVDPKIHCIRMSEDTTLVELMRDQWKGTETKDGDRLENGLDQLKTPDAEETSVPRWNQFKPILDNERIYVRNTGNKIQISKAQRRAIKKLSSQAYEIDTDITDFLAEDGGKNYSRLAKAMGFKTEEERANLSYDQQLSAEGVNNAINAQILALIDGAKKQKKFGKEFTGIYFDYFVSRNGRLFIDSTELNPQTQKLHRFLCTPRSVWFTYKSNAKNRALESYAIAQAFDVLDSATKMAELNKTLSSLSMEELLAMRDKLLDGETAFKVAYGKNGNVKPLGLKVESLFQCLHVIQHLIRKKQANGKPFETNLMLENDSATSGYALKLLSFPFPEMIGFLEKVGIFTKDSKAAVKPIHMLKKMKAFLDIYKTTGKEVSETIEKLKGEDGKAHKAYGKIIYALKKDYARRHKISVKEVPDDAPEVKESASIISYTFRNMIDALPKAEPDGTVSSELRTLMKPPTMVFGYSAGIGSISRKVSYEIMNKFIATYMDVMASGGKRAYYEANGLTDLKNEEVARKVREIESIVNTMEGIGRRVPQLRYDQSFATLLKKKSYADIKVRVEKTGKRVVSLDTFFNMVLAPTYGAAIGDALESAFNPLVRINTKMTNLSGTMAHLYMRMRNQLIKEAKKTSDNGKVSVEQMRKIEKQLQPLLPYITLANNQVKINDAKMLIMGDTRVTDYSNRVQNLITVRQTEGKYKGYRSASDSTTAYANVREPDYPGRSGAVIPIHGLDGALVCDVVNYFGRDNGMTLVHDAIVMSAFASDEITHGYNKSMLKRCSEYNVFSNMVENTIRVIENCAKMLGTPVSKFVDTEYMITGHGSVVTDEAARGRKMTIGEYMAGIFNDALDIHVLRGDFYQNNTIVNGNMDSASKNGMAPYDASIDGYGQSDFIEAMERLKPTVINEEISDSNKNDRFDFAGYERVVDVEEEFNDAIYAEPEEEIEDDNQLAYMDTSNTSSDAVYENLDSDEEVQQSGPRGYQTDGAIKYSFEQALSSADARANFVIDLQNLAKAEGSLTCSDEHASFLMKMIRKIAPESCTNLIVKLANNGKFNAGEINLAKNEITIVNDNKKNIDPVTKMAVESHQSSAETYAHEMVHLGTNYAFKHRSVFGFAKEISQLQYIQKEAMGIITWQDFMPDKYDPSLQQFYEQHAKATWDYIFDNKQDRLRGLSEFCAYAMTNEKLRRKLEGRYAQPKDNFKSKNLVDKLVSIISGIFDVLFKGGKFSEIFSGTYEVAKGNMRATQKSLIEDLDELIYKMYSANTQVANNLMSHPMKLAERLFGVMGDFCTRWDNWLHDKFEKAVTYSDRHNKNLIGAIMTPVNASWWDKTKLLGRVMKVIGTSRIQRRELRRALVDIWGWNQQGVWMSILRDVTEPDLQSSNLELLTLRNKRIDGLSKSTEAAYFKELIEAFGDTPPTKLERHSITNAILYTNSQALYNGKNLDYLLDLYRNKQKVATEIQNREKILLDNYSKVVAVAHASQCLGRALYMTEELSNPALVMNSRLQAEGLLFKNSKDMKIKPEHVKVLEELTALYAIQNTKQDYLTVTASLNRRGLETFLKHHQEFVHQSLTGVKTTDLDGNETIIPTIESMHVAEGYTKQLYDPNIELTKDIVTPQRQEELRNAGWELRCNVKENAVTQLPSWGLYTRLGFQKHTDGNAAVMTGEHAVGTSLRDMATEIINRNNLNITTRSLHNVYMQNAEKERNRMMNRMLSGKMMTADDFRKMSSGYCPILGPNGVTDYRFTMRRETKRDVLGLNEDAFMVLSKMYGSAVRKAHASEGNKILINFLKRDVKDNMNKYFRDKEGHKYIELTPTTKNEYLKEMWNAIPKEFKEEMKKEPFYVREDWLQYLFGVPSMSILDVGWVQKIPSYRVKRALAVAEMIQKTLTYWAKEQIVFRIPFVLIGNIISNFNYSLMTHQNPLKVFKATVANAKAIRDYIDNRKALDRIIVKQRIGTATEAEIKSKTWYKNKLESNIVHPLMEKGMYQAIVEDINPAELETMGKVSGWLKNNVLVSKIPNSIKWVSKQLYMTRGTPIFDFMFTATQYSDFIARATQYQLIMDETPHRYEIDKREGRTNKTYVDYYKEQEHQASIDVLNAFINYDRPQSKGEQYLNDMGFLLFTKFAKRIQHVVLKEFWHHPVHSLLFLMTQSWLLDTEDITEQMFLFKKWSALGHTPFDIFATATMPVPLQYATDMR